MRILLVTYSEFHDGQLGGGGTYAYRLSRELARQGHHVDVIANMTRPLEARTPFAVYDLKLSTLRFIGILKWSVAATVYSMKLMTMNSYDIVHVIHFVSNTYPLMWSSRIPMVATMQQGWALTNPRLSRLRRIIEFMIDLAVCKKYRRTIVLNRDLEFQLLSWGISREKIRLIPNGIDCSEFLRERSNSTILRQKLGVPREAIVVLSVGRLIEGKGVENLLDAWQIVQRDASKAVWAVVVGDGPLRRSLMKRAHDIPNIVFTGSMDREDLLSAYAESDLFVMPSEGGEGMPTVLLEAMAAGLPVIATRIPGNTEIVDTTFGKFVPPGDARQLALALLDLIRDPTSLRRMGKQALLLSKRYDWSIIVARIVKVYESCLEK